MSSMPLVFSDQDLQTHNTLGLPARAAVATLDDESAIPDLCEALSSGRETDAPLFVLGGGSNLVELPQLAPDDAIAWGRDLMSRHPETDTLLYPCPHWATVEAIEPLEREFGINVVTNLQATVWHALRKCGVGDRIDGYGRLLREH